MWLLLLNMLFLLNVLQYCSFFPGKKAGSIVLSLARREEQVVTPLHLVERLHSIWLKSRYSILALVSTVLCLFLSMESGNGKNEV